ncbi:MAG: hypothetical protein ACK4GN_08760 [Runella sp.]
MITFFQILKSRNETLFYFGAICFVLALFFWILSYLTDTTVFKVNAWFKPLKFALSIGLYAWTMAWYCYYLPNFNIKLFNWTIIVLLGLEIAYIAIQAGRGQLSHYNISTPFYATLYIGMAVAASLVALYTAYVGILFFTDDFSTLPPYYLWAIRCGILIFVIFSFEGFAMGSRLNHSVGALNDNSNLFIIGWSKTVGDLRVAHFIGMHALQVLPIASFYVLKSTKYTIALAILYGLFAILTLMQALQAKPFFK